MGVRSGRARCERSTISRSRVATFPEGHPDSRSLDAELDNLKRKIDAGATRAITQFFFDNWTYLRYVDRARKAGITVPIVPGIMPVTNFTQMTRFAAQAGATVPRTMAPLFEGLENDPETRKLVAATVAAEQCRQLAEAGVTEFHFYTLNRADLAYALCHILGLRPDGRQTADGGRKLGRRTADDGQVTNDQGPMTGLPAVQSVHTTPAPRCRARPPHSHPRRRDGHGDSEASS